MNDRLPRKLVAILYADVAEYSRLTGDDEDATHRILSDYLDLIAQIIESHRGRVMHYAGDAVLAMFDAVVDSVSCATDIQEQLHAQNNNLTEQRKVQFRIGVNSGDVIEDRGDIYGDGVNVAARLEALADPGGICISDAVRIAIGNKLGLAYEDLGEQQVKNISEAVRAFKIIAGKKEEIAANSQDSSPIKLPEKPSIAVLPFTNMSSDNEQEYFSDGITEDIITALSKTSALAVIARNSTFTYKDKAVDVKQVGLDLGVHYILEGSVRKSGSRVRVTAQLIDATTNQHIWAERYDRDLEDFFAVQDEIMREIVSALDIQLLAGEQSRFWSSGTQNLQAWEYFRLARDLLNTYQTENHPEVIRLCRKAIDADSEYAAAWDLLAGCYFHMEEDARYSEEERRQALQFSHEYTQRALECDPSFSHGYSMLALLHLNSKQYDEAAISINKSIEMAPNPANILGVSAIVLNKCGEPGIAMECIRKAIRLSPVYPLWYLAALGQVTRSLGRIDESSDAFSEMVNRDPDSLEGYIGLAEILGESGQIEAARDAAVEVIRINPNFSINEYADNLAYSDPNEIERFAEGLRIAGLPE